MHAVVLAIQRPGSCLTPALVLLLHVAAESVAFYNGEVREMSVAARRLNSLIDISRLRIRWSAWLSLWTNCYSYATLLAPAFITAPMYFRGEIEFGVISQVYLLFKHCLANVKTAEQLAYRQVAAAG